MQESAKFDRGTALKALRAEPVDQARGIGAFDPVIVFVVGTVSEEDRVDFLLEHTSPIGKRKSCVRGILVVGEAETAIDFVLVDVVDPQRHHTEGFRW